MISCVVCLAAGGLVSLDRNKVVGVSVEFPCPGIGPEPVKIAVFSDLDFESVGDREGEIRDIIHEYQPDLVLVAGDFINRVDLITERKRVEDAGKFLGSLSTKNGTLLVPGEDESFVLDELSEVWSGVPKVLSNDASRHVFRGGILDLYGIHPRKDRVPWPLAEENGRAFVFARGRSHMSQQRLVYTGKGAESWENVEITVAFQPLEDNTYIDFRFAWKEGDAPEGGNGWRITRHEWRKDFKAYLRPSETKRLEGRYASGFVPRAGVWYRSRIRLEDDGTRAHVQARFWEEGTQEPETWHLDVTDRHPDRYHKGTIALGGRRGVRRYADLEVRDLAGRLLLKEDFSDARAFRSRWDSGCLLEHWLYDQDEPGTVRILLAHEPDAVIDVADAVDELGRKPCLVVAGHTHGGQIRIPGFGALYTATQIGRKYDRGLFDYRGVPIYITAGIGTSLIPIRLFNPPEVTLLTLVSPSEPLGRSKSP